MADNSYPGQYLSAIARAKKVLLKAGFPWSKTVGRYSPFGGQRVSRGVRVQRIGLSETVAVHVYGYSYYRSEDEEGRLVHALAIATLRDAGMPFDDRGWLACGRDAKR